jgi:hypothetical protein
MKQVKEKGSRGEAPQPSEPVMVTLYGQSKIGLSSIAAQFPGVLVLNVSDRLEQFGVREECIESWEGFLKVGMAVSEGKYAELSWLCIAHIGALWELCADHAVMGFNRQNGTSAKTTSEASYAVWKEALRTFESKLQKLSRLANLLILEHEQPELRNTFGVERTFIQPALEKHVLLKVSHQSDCIGRVFMVESGARMASFQPAPHQLAGSRLPELLHKQFVLSPGVRPEFMDLICQPRPVSISA